MSTTINVTVGGNGLLDQSRQQMQANRFGRLERDQDRKTEEQATEQQQKRQEQTEPTGRPAQSRRSDPEPAAFRRGGDVVFEPAFSPLTVDGIKYFPIKDYKTRLNATLVDGALPADRGFFRAYEYSFDYGAPDLEYGRVLLAQGAGPSGSNALLMQVRTPWAGGYDVAATGCGYYSGAPLPSNDSSPVYQRTFTSILNPLLGYPATYTMYAYYCSAGEIQETQVFIGATEAYVSCAAEDTFTSQDNWLKAFSSPSGNKTAEVMVKTQQAEYAVIRVSFGGVGLAFNGQSGELTFYEGYYNQHNSPEVRRVTTSVDANTFTGWAHLAVSLNDAGTEVSCYFNGAKIGVFSPAEGKPELFPSRLEFGQDFGGKNLQISYESELLLHGYRISKRARYTGNFTPPTVIR